MFFEESKYYSKDINILCNTDIYFDETIFINLKELLIFLFYFNVSIYRYLPTSSCKCKKVPPSLPTKKRVFRTDSNLLLLIIITYDLKYPSFAKNF